MYILADTSRGRINTILPASGGRPTMTEYAEPWILLWNGVIRIEFCEMLCLLVLIWAFSLVFASGMGAVGGPLYVWPTRGDKVVSYRAEGKKKSYDRMCGSI